MQSAAAARCAQPASAARESMDVDAESKKLLGLGQKHLVMGNVPAAVNAFQEAASLLGKKYGETADECAEAFFYYGKSLLELARMENGVLGNALEGVQVEEEGEKAEDNSALPAVDEEAREELREQVYNAMGEEEEVKKSPVLTEKEIKGEDVEMEDVTEEKPKEETVTDVEVKLEGSAEKTETSVEKVNSEEHDQQTAVEKNAEAAVVEEKAVEKEQDTKHEEAEATEGRNSTKEVLDEKVKAAVEENEAAEAPAEKKGGAGEQTAGTAETETAVEENESVEGQAEEKAVSQEGTAEGQAAAVAEQKEAAEEQAEAVEKKVEEKESVETAPEQKPDESKEVDSSKEPVSAVGEDPANDTGEKTEVAAKVEKEEKKDDQMEESEGAKVEKEEKDDQMEEGEETEESEEEDKENDKAEDDKENELAVEDKESEEEEIGNLELAWDMLELAKVIYKRQETKEAQLHAAQAHLKLGEVSIESENYVQAIEEFQACLALQQKYLEAHDRLLAESHYQLALAYHYNSQFDEAVLQFGKSMEVIDKRMAMLTERIKKAESGSPEDEKEIEELKGLLPEIKEKIEDSKESQKSARVAELALKATLVGTTSGFAQSEGSGSVSTIPVRKAADGASQCVTDISHLVRKKRKPEEETHQGDNEAKKSKAEPAVNGGGGDAAPSGNEVAEKMEEETEKRPQAEPGAAVESTV
ncbi:nuclear autoantigenic sperm protein isoform X2 [Coturnix japonica]|uniref:nuclear autoantigenic sperm protein isoform X2 n=1 Tax=Coturnix japonica TaxID=93934 RepID=UPI000777EA5E|nr:nuclear autoantigenic sperm protein isoform X2 [Coturnix japonica]